MTPRISIIVPTTMRTISPLTVHFRPERLRRDGGVARLARVDDERLLAAEVRAGI
jgi:hypothetical protein